MNPIFTSYLQYGGVQAPRKTDRILQSYYNAQRFSWIEGSLHYISRLFFKIIQFVVNSFVSSHHAIQDLHEGMIYIAPYVKQSSKPVRLNVKPLDVEELNNPFHPDYSPQKRVVDNTSPPVHPLSITPLTLEAPLSKKVVTHGVSSQSSSGPLIPHPQNQPQKNYYEWLQEAGRYLSEKIPPFLGQQVPAGWQKLQKGWFLFACYPESRSFSREFLDSCPEKVKRMLIALGPLFALAQGRIGFGLDERVKKKKETSSIFERYILSPLSKRYQVAEDTDSEEEVVATESDEKSYYSRLQSEIDQKKEDCRGFYMLNEGARYVFNAVDALGGIFKRFVPSSSEDFDEELEFFRSDEKTRDIICATSIGGLIQKFIYKHEFLQSIVVEIYKNPAKPLNRDNYTALFTQGKEIFTEKFNEHMRGESSEQANALRIVLSRSSNFPHTTIQDEIVKVVLDVIFFNHEFNKAIRFEVSEWREGEAWPQWLSQNYATVFLHALAARNEKYPDFQSLVDVVKKQMKTSQRVGASA